MSVINDLINKIQDSDLKNRIQEEVDKLSKQKKLVLFLRNICLNALLCLMFQFMLVAK